ncbi:hypothetical protein SUGI_0717200 [Cryptomeria japonica]|nr:hypothetical protein SUGI_0717200 [Cryptomeria japonica]
MVVEIFSWKRSRELSENGLFSLLQVKAEEGRLSYLVYDGHEDDEMSIREQAVKLMKVAIWCVQDDFMRRPAMLTVVKALEGLTIASNQQLHASINYNRDLSYTPASVLSLPRQCTLF